MSNKKDERLDTYTDEDVVEEIVEDIEIPKQLGSYKMPRRFGSIPVDEPPKGCDPDHQYRKIYPRIPLPFQQAARIPFGYPKLEPNKLIWGDNLHVMRMLPSNSIDLIYIDPPFFSGVDYNVIFGDQNEIRSFSDIWEGGMSSYLIWFNARLLEMKRLLKSTGTIFVHLDYHASHYVKIELDKIFGYDNFINEIIWHYQTGGASKQWYSKKHDVILVYGKSKNYKFYPDRIKTERTEKSMKRAKNPKGARIKSTDSMKLPMDVWTDIQALNPMSNERVGYPTQKPEKLLERIILGSSDEGDVVADFFCGGGTTPITAQKWNRRWIASDQSRVAVAITQGRIETEYENTKSKQQTIIPTPDISIEYFGTYESPALEELSQDDFSNFILAAFGGRPSSAGETIHGYKREMPIFVGPSKQNSQVTKENVLNFAEEISKTKGKFQGTMLAWSFASSARIAVEKLLGEGNPGADLIQISLTDIESPQFREDALKKGNDYESFLKFILPPEVIVNHKRLGPRTYEFDTSESISINEGAKIVNIQWDFEYLGRFTPTRGFAYGRGVDAEALSNVQYKFGHLGETKMACRVQDDLGGEKIYTEVIYVE